MCLTLVPLGVTGGIPHKETIINNMLQVRSNLCSLNKMQLTLL